MKIKQGFELFGNDWSNIATYVGEGINSNQCRDRYFNQVENNYHYDKKFDDDSFNFTAEMVTIYFMTYYLYL